MSKANSQRFYYGWVVVAACVFIGIVSHGIRYSYGVFFTSLEQDFGWSRTLTSGVFSSYMMLCCIFAILGGLVFDRYGPRLVIILMGCFIGLSLLLTSFAGSLWHIFISYSLLLAIGTGPTYTVTMAAASRWFVRRRGLAIALVGAGAGIGIIVMAPFAAYLNSAYGWQTAFFILGIVALFTIPPSSLLLKSSPAAVNAPTAGGSKLDGFTGKSEKSVDRQEDLSLLQALRTGNFWIVFFVWVFYSLCLHLVLTHLVPHAMDMGISAIKAATVLTLLGGMSIPGRVVMGRLSDSIGRKKAGIISALIMAGSMLLLMEGTSLWSLYAFGVIFGISYGAIDPPVVAIVGDVFGVRHIGIIMGALVVGWSAGAAIGPAVGGYVFDIYGSYDYAFLLGVVIMVITAALISFIKRHENRALSLAGH